MYLPKSSGRRTATAIFLLPSLIGLVVFCLVPMISSLVYSFMDYDLLAGNMKFIGFRNFERILTGAEFPKVLGHTLTYLGLYLPLILLTSVVEALILNHDFKGRGFFRAVFYTPVITSWVAAAVVWTWVLSGKYGLLNQLLETIGIT